MNYELLYRGGHITEPAAVNRLPAAGNLTARRGKHFPRRAVTLPAVVNRNLYKPSPPSTFSVFRAVQF